MPFAVVRATREVTSLWLMSESLGVGSSVGGNVLHLHVTVSSNEVI